MASQPETAPRPARPSRRRRKRQGAADPSTDNRARLLEAARRVVVAQGLSGATVSEIAREAGISAGFVHYYFGGKDALLLAARETISEEVRAAGAAFDAPGASALDRLKAQALCWFDPAVFTPELCSLWIQFYAYGESNPEVAEQDRQSALQARKLLMQRARACAPAAQAREIVDLLAPLMEGLWVRRAQNDPAVEPAKAKRIITRAIDRWAATL